MITFFNRIVGPELKKFFNGKSDLTESKHSKSQQVDTRLFGIWTNDIFLIDNKPVSVKKSSWVLNTDKSGVINFYDQELGMMVTHEVFWETETNSTQYSNNNILKRGIINVETKNKYFMMEWEYVYQYQDNNKESLLIYNLGSSPEEFGMWFEKTRDFN